MLGCGKSDHGAFHDPSTLALGPQSHPRASAPLQKLGNLQDRYKLRCSPSNGSIQKTCRTASSQNISTSPQLNLLS